MIKLDLHSNNHSIGVRSHWSISGAFLEHHVFCVFITRFFCPRRFVLQAFPELADDEAGSWKSGQGFPGWLGVSWNGEIH